MSALADFVMNDDIDLALDPESYPEQAGPAPVSPGNYRLRVESMKPRVDQQGTPVTRRSRVPGFENHNFPVLVIEKVRIVEPVELTRDVMLWQDISTAPFLREGRVAGQLQDIVRAYDQTFAAASLAGLMQALDEFVGAQQTFAGWLDWTSYANDWVKAQIEALGPNASPEQKNALYNKARIKGYKKFPKTSSGRPSHIWTGPDGLQSIEARPLISRFYASGEERINYGPAREFRTE